MLLYFVQLFFSFEIWQQEPKSGVTSGMRKSCCCFFLLRWSNVWSILFYHGDRNHQHPFQTQTKELPKPEERKTMQNHQQFRAVTTEAPNAPTRMRLLGQILKLSHYLVRSCCIEISFSHWRVLSVWKFISFGVISAITQGIDFSPVQSSPDFLSKCNVVMPGPASWQSLSADWAYSQLCVWREELIPPVSIDSAAHVYLAWTHEESLEGSPELGL